mmetsp:Transcript_30433/g.35096  ORF Transcript_30433/g.35096 Transcript_30433/m.35096 type:complete len:658 (-) Transcript_30433:568-2541(-)
MAARAIAALCSGNGAKHITSSRAYLMSHCFSRLDRDTSLKNCWNEVHGALLALQMLLRSMPCPLDGVLDNPQISKISYFASWTSAHCICPPSIAAVAIEILSEVHERCAASRENISLKSVARTAFNCTEFFVGRSSINMIGQGYLSSVSAKALIQSLHDDALDPAGSDESRRTSLDAISSICKSESFDAAWAGIKALKKRLSFSIDGVLNKDTYSKRDRAHILREMCFVLYDVLKCEYAKDPHPPNLRRLSRCILELVKACKILHGDTIFTKACLKSNWDMFVGLQKLGGSKNITGRTTKIYDEENAGNGLSGNALELMSFCLGALYEVDGLNENMISELSQFRHALLESTDPLSPLEVRHSAAMSIGFVGILTWEMHEGELTHELHKKVEIIKLDLYITAIKLLQDNDVDVRFASMKSLMLSSKSNTMHPSVPSLVLESIFNEMNTSFNVELLTIRLLQLIAGASLSLEATISAVKEELAHTNGKDKSNLNLGVKRKIFEYEDPNPFEEDLVILQLAVATLTHSGKVISCTESSHILRRGAKMLDDLKDYMTNKFIQDPVHDIFRHSAVFAAAFGLALSSACIIYLGGHDKQNDVVQKSKQVLDLIEKNTSQVNSLFLDVLRALSNAEQGRKETQVEVLQCCFLLKASRLLVCTRT